jgi:hypothetical protein
MHQKCWQTNSRRGGAHYFSMAAQILATAWNRVIDSFIEQRGSERSSSLFAIYAAAVHIILKRARLWNWIYIMDFIISLPPTGLQSLSLSRARHCKKNQVPVPPTESAPEKRALIHFRRDAAARALSRKQKAPAGWPARSSLESQLPRQRFIESVSHFLCIFPNKSLSAFAIFSLSQLSSMPHASVSIFVENIKLLLR